MIANPTTDSTRPTACSDAADGQSTLPPLVSVVLPVYNGQRYLREALDGMLAQTYPAWELIIIDDASKDATAQIIGEYEAREPRIRSFRNPANKRLPGSLNVGFSHTRGTYLTWTSDDNRQRPHALERMVTFLEEHRDVDLVYTDVTLIDGDGGPIRKLVAGAAETLGWTNPVGASFLYRRAVHERLGGYREDRCLIEDWEFWLRSAESFRLVPLHEDLYEYRVHAQSLTALRRKEAYKALDQLLNEYLPRMHWLTPATRAKVYLSLAWGAVVCEERAAARRYLSRAWGCSSKAVLTDGRAVAMRAYLGETLAGAITGVVRLARGVLGRDGRIDALPNETYQEQETYEHDRA